ncbi:MAG TPA: hypothetical protein VFV66_09410 [Nonomuraea sp.]|nr:hypothetical protein [Nonomuraea sp.]
MRSSLTATGGALLAAAALFAGAAPAAADGNDSWGDWSKHYPHKCSLGVNDDSTYHHVTKHGVYAGTRDADGCKSHSKKDDDHKWWDSSFTGDAYGLDSDDGRDD